MAFVRELLDGNARRRDAVHRHLAAVCVATSTLRLRSSFPPGKWELYSPTWFFNQLQWVFVTCKQELY